MKTSILNKIFIVFGIMILTCVSCEDFIDLDTPSKSDYSSDNLFQTVSQARKIGIAHL